MNLIGGVDEAGRGCIIGSLFVAAFACGETEEKTLYELGARDSKTLSPSKRDEIFDKLTSGAWKYEVTEYSAKQLTELMRSKVSLNDIEAAMVAEALSKLSPLPPKIFVDSPDPTAGRFEKRIRKFFTAKADFVCENKADSKYPVVSAASVVAKVLRDRQIDRLKEKIGDFGSGYTSDVKTAKFVNENLDDPKVAEFLRWEWKTIKGKDSAQNRL